ncbi:MAG: hypothetical protein Fues2KO_15550 [Fuerstiella sp.]
MSKDVRSVASLVRRKEVAEAKQILADVEAKLEELQIPDDERDRTFRSLKSALDRARNAIPVSFESDVAPIIRENCLNCHGANNPRGNLRLDTYANMGRGGQSGPLLLPRIPQRSHIMARITTDNDQARMPKGGDRLSDEQISIIGRWIAGGAEFDGEDMTQPIGQSAVSPKPPIKVVMADGSETVSFKNDIAPWIVNVCSGCHNGRRKSGGYDLSTFETLLQGGESGTTVVPGDPDSSYIVDLVLRQDPLKMPAGNMVNLKRSQAVALETWIKEGAHFDGTDPKATIRSLVPTAAELEAQRLMTMSDQEFAERRMTQAKELWERVSPRQNAESVTTDNLYVYGNAPQSRLQQIADWGEAKVTQLTEQYELPAGEKPWRGRLIVFVGKERFDYTEFNTVLMNRQTPRTVSGHAVVSNNFADAYIAMHDVGDDATDQQLPAQQLTNSLIAQAFLMRSGGSLPDWLQQGFGLLESGADQTSPYFQALPQTAGQALSSVAQPATLFDNGTFSPDEVGAVGYLLTRFLVKNGGMQKLGQFVQAYQQNRNSGQAIQAAYGQNAAALGQAFLRSGGR